MVKKILTFSAAALLCSCGSDRNLAEVHFVLSNRLNSKIHIILDETTDNEIRKTDGQYRIFVSPSGVVRVKSLEPLLQRHIQMVNFEGGASVPIIGPSSHSDRRYWWNLGEEVIDGATTRLIFAVATRDGISKVDTFALVR